MVIPSHLPATLGALKRDAGGRRSHRTVKDEVRANLIQRLRAGEPLFSGVVGVRRHGHPAAGQRHSLEAQLHPAGAARPGQDAAAARASSTLLDESIPVVAGCEIHDDPFDAAVRIVPGSAAADRATDLPIAWLVARRALRREAGDARRDHRRPHRRRRSDQGRAARPRAGRRADHALRPAAARPTAASSPSTSCRTWPARSRWASSTSCRKATCS